MAGLDPLSKWVYDNHPAKMITSDAWDHFGAWADVNLRHLVPHPLALKGEYQFKAWLCLLPRKAIYCLGGFLCRRYYGTLSDIPSFYLGFSLKAK